MSVRLRFSMPVLVALLLAACQVDRPIATLPTGLVSTDALAVEGAGANDYVMTDLGGFGGRYNRASSINDSGEIVGTSTWPGETANEAHAFILKDGVLSPLPTLAGFQNSGARSIDETGRIIGMNYTPPFGPTPSVMWESGGVFNLQATYPTLASAASSNALGKIVGVCWVTQGPFRWGKACLLVNGVTTFLDTTSQSGNSAAFAINDAGKVVGRTDPNRNGTDHATEWINGVATLLPPISPPGATEAVDVNAAGDVVGSSTALVGQWRFVHATLWRNGVPIDLGAVGGSISRATAINDRGHVVGVSRLPNQNERAFLWRRGRMLMLPTGAMRIEASLATGINNHNEIVGMLMLPNGEQRAVVWRPH